MRMTVESPVVATTMMVGTTFGRMWVSVVRRCPAPRARALSTKVCSLTSRATPRTTREFWMPKAMPSTIVMFHTLGPSSDMIESSRSSGGKAIHASTARCTSRSKRPPR